MHDKTKRGRECSHVLSVSSLFTHYALLKHHFLPPRQAIFDPLHHHAQVLLAMRKVQIIVADGQHWAKIRSRNHVNFGASGL
ncbi:MAG: hypothetical protein R6X34_08620 [Chloroflexota bacterium]